MYVVDVRLRENYYSIEPYSQELVLVEYDRQFAATVQCRFYLCKSQQVDRPVMIHPPRLYDRNTAFLHTEPYISYNRTTRMCRYEAYHGNI